MTARHFKDEVLTIEEARKFLKVSRNTMYKLVRSGGIPAKKVGAEWRIIKSNLINWMNQNNSRS